VSLSGVGSVLGPLVIALMAGVRAKGAIVVAAMMLSGVALMGVGFAPVLMMAMGLVVGLGLFDSTQRVLTNSLLLTQTDPAYHGRVVSLYLLDRGFVPIGGVAAGYLAEALSASAALVILGAAMVVTVGLLAVTQPRFLMAR
jgi:hypothetical protein